MIVGDPSGTSGNPQVRKFDRIHAIGKAQGTVDIFRLIQGRQGNEISRLSCLVLRPRRLLVSILKTGDLGLLLDYKKNSLGLVVREVLPKGHIAEWNQSHPQDAVLEGDRFLEVNGSASAAEAMLEEIKTSSQLSFTVLKYPTPGPFGVSVSPEPWDLGPQGPL
eukprot:Skav220414  [mRNA]  locus=scaffold639:533594:534085:+ [translate_table: standard]